MPLYNLTNAAWTKIASAGASVEVQNLSVGATRLTTSATLPAVGADGEVLYDYNSLRQYAAALPNDLYAIAQNATSTVEVMAIGASGGGGGSTTVSTTYNSTPPTLTNGQTAPLQSDSSGNLKVTGSFSATTTGTASSAAPTYTAGPNPLSLDLSGNLRTSVAGSVAVTGTFFQATQPVSGSVSVSNLPATQPVSGSVAVSNFPATQPVSATALPLPSGAATAASQIVIQAAPGTSVATAAGIQGVTGGVPVPTAPAAGENHLGEVGGNSAVAIASLTRPANTTAYASGQLVANSTAAGSVAAMSLAVARKTGGTARVTRARLSTSNPGAAASSPVMFVDLYKGSAAGTGPVSTAGDGASATGAVNGVAAVYLGTLSVALSQAFSDGSKGIGTPLVGAYITIDTYSGTQNIYALIRTGSAYTPVSGEVFTVALEVDRD